jgi:hypothetical protein
LGEWLHTKHLKKASLISGMMELHRITMPFTDTNLSMSANTHSRHLNAAQVCENYSSKDLASREWYATEKMETCNFLGKCT